LRDPGAELGVAREHAGELEDAGHSRI
jgi:hypothetical protein